MNRFEMSMCDGTSNGGSEAMNAHLCTSAVSPQHEFASADSLAINAINYGVNLYERGCVQEAMMAFAEALALTKHLECWYDEDDFMYDDEETALPPFQPHFGKSDQSITSSNGLFIFLNPIKVQGKLPKNKLRKSLSLIALFNLAICNHRNGILRNMDHSCLQKALQMYELAYAIQMQNGIDMTLTPTMIIMSNVGHIHKILGNNDNSMQCFQHLLSTIMFLVEAGERDHIFEFDGFFENILKTVYANAPAAAA